MLPTSTTGSDYEGQFYLGYEDVDSTVIPVNVTHITASKTKLRFELTLNSTAEQDNTYPVVGLISPYYWNYFVNTN